MTQLSSSDAAHYTVNRSDSVWTDEYILARAWAIINQRAVKAGTVFDSPTSVKEYLSMANAQYSDQSRERFAALFLDARHALIEYRVLFEGTLTQTSVYPRELIRAALSLDAAAVILTHNHPSGNLEASSADKLLTSTLKTALTTVDVRLLDHIITCRDTRTLSMAEQGDI